MPLVDQRWLLSLTVCAPSRRHSHTNPVPRHCPTPSCCSLSQGHSTPSRSSFAGSAGCMRFEIVAVNILSPALSRNDVMYRCSDDVSLTKQHRWPSLLSVPNASMRGCPRFLIAIFFRSHCKNHSICGLHARSCNPHVRRSKWRQGE